MGGCTSTSTPLLSNHSELETHQHWVTPHWASVLLLFCAEELGLRSFQMISLRTSDCFCVYLTRLFWSAARFSVLKFNLHTGPAKHCGETTWSESLPSLSVVLVFWLIAMCSGLKANWHCLSFALILFAGLNENLWAGEKNVFFSFSHYDLLLLFLYDNAEIHGSIHNIKDSWSSVAFTLLFWKIYVYVYLEKETFWKQTMNNCLAVLLHGFVHASMFRSLKQKIKNTNTVSAFMPLDSVFLCE